MKLSRNDPCHCGSEKKYKKCCLHLDEEQAQIAKDAPAEAAEPPQPIGATPFILGALGLALTLGIGSWRGVGAGLIVASAWGLGMLIYLSLRRPPPPRPDAGNPAGLDFGR